MSLTSIAAKLHHRVRTSGFGQQLGIVRVEQIGDQQVAFLPERLDLSGNSGWAFVVTFRFS